MELAVTPQNFGLTDLDARADELGLLRVYHRLPVLDIHQLCAPGTHLDPPLIL